MGKNPDNGNTKDVGIAVPWKYLSNFSITLEIPLIKCEIKDTRKAYFCYRQTLF